VHRIVHTYCVNVKCQLQNLHILRRSFLRDIFKPQIKNLKYRCAQISQSDNFASVWKLMKKHSETNVKTASKSNHEEEHGNALLNHLTNVISLHNKIVEYIVWNTYTYITFFFHDEFIFIYLLTDTLWFKKHQGEEQCPQSF
jgi:L-lactate utilization protein LutC